jgi:SRSO17 transposase
VAFARWSVERCFEDSKKYIGRDHYEGRCYTGLTQRFAKSSITNAAMHKPEQVTAKSELLNSPNLTQAGGQTLRRVGTEWHAKTVKFIKRNDTIVL